MHGQDVKVLGYSRYLGRTENPNGILKNTPRNRRNANKPRWRTHLIWFGHSYRVDSAQQIAIWSSNPLRSKEIRLASLCIANRAPNNITVKNRYPLPRIDHLFDRLQGAKYFTSLGLSQGYHQIRMNEKHVPQTAFNTPMGHFELKVLSFGLTNAPATLCSLMNGIFGGLAFATVYRDDIIVFLRRKRSTLNTCGQYWTSYKSTNSTWISQSAPFSRKKWSTSAS